MKNILAFILFLFLSIGFINPVSADQRIKNNTKSWRESLDNIAKDFIGEYFLSVRKIFGKKDEYDTLEKFRQATQVRKEELLDELDQHTIPQLRIALTYTPVLTNENSFFTSTQKELLNRFTERLTHLSHVKVMRRNHVMEVINKEQEF